MSKFIAAAKGFVKGEEGATMVEYGLMVALIAVVCIVAVTLLGDEHLSVIFGYVAGESVLNRSLIFLSSTSDRAGWTSGRRPWAHPACSLDSATRRTCLRRDASFRHEPIMSSHHFQGAAIPWSKFIAAAKKLFRLMRPPRWSNMA